jgi:hypothetical protein
MSDPWFTNPRLEMSRDDYAPDYPDWRETFEVDRALDELGQDDSLYSDEVSGTRLRRYDDE